MSLLEDVKDELAAIGQPDPCCRLWETRGYLEVWGQSAGPRLRAFTDSAAAARRLYALLKAVGADRVKVARRPKGGFMVAALHPGDEALPALPRPRCCRRSYLRGAFLARGFLSATSHGYHWEIKTPNELHADRLKQVMDWLGLKGARVGRWQKGWVTYLKDGAEIAGWLGQVGAHGALLKLENTRVEKAMRNQVNRRVNYETANLSRTVSAAMRQKEDIRLIERTIGLASLPPPLRSLAEARLAQPLASLSELANVLRPSLSKSGASHRMRQISLVASQIRIDSERRKGRKNDSGTRIE